jgi:hypothetical protein
MSSKATFSAVVTVVVAATMMIAGQSFAASAPTPEPSQATQPRAARPAPTPAPAEARRAEAVRTRPHFTG